MACDQILPIPFMQFLCFHQEYFLNQNLVSKCFYGENENKIFEIRTILENLGLVRALVFSWSFGLT